MFFVLVSLAMCFDMGSCHLSVCQILKSVDSGRSYSMGREPIPACWCRYHNLPPLGRQYQEHGFCGFARAWWYSWYCKAGPCCFNVWSELVPVCIHHWGFYQFGAMSYFIVFSWASPGTSHSHISSSICSKLKSLGVCFLLGQFWFSTTFFLNENLVVQVNSNNHVLFIHSELPRTIHTD